MSQDVPPWQPSTPLIDETQPTLRPWLGLALAVPGLLAAGVALLLILLRDYRDGWVPVALWWLLAGCLLVTYGGLWLVLRASMPRAAAQRLGVVFACGVTFAWEIGVPVLAIALALIFLAGLLLLSSGPVVFISWVDARDRAARQPPS